MISKKYSLQEAFEKRLLESDEYVNTESLYTPRKKIVQIDSFGLLRELSLYSYFGEDTLRRAEILKASDGAIKVFFYKKNTTSSTANLVASKLLSEDIYGIKASCNLDSQEGYQEEWRFIITINPDIIVRFEGEEETPVLELPPHKAYTVN